MAPRGPRRGEIRQFWRTFSRNQLAMCGGAVVTVLVFLAVLAPALAPWDPNRPDTRKIISLSVGFVSVGIAAAIGMLLGAAAGYYGGVVDNVVMRLVDLMLVFPRFFLLLAVLAFLKPSIWTIMTVIGLTGWMGVARLVRAEFLTLREREFVIWSESVGAGALRIIFRHILPNAIAPILVAMTLGIPAAILTEAGLSFLGLGVQPPYATWGNILNDGRDYIEIAWWLTLYPGLAILITVLSYNLMGEGIRDALDPRLRQSRVGRILRLGR